MWWHANEGLIAVTTVVLTALAIEFGFRLGRRHSGRASAALDAHLGNLQSALLGLLALLLGFTFAMAVGRFDTRKELVLAEANAIGTAALRADFLPAPDRDEARALLRAYATSRLDFFKAGVNANALEQSYQEAATLQAGLWSIAVERAQAEPGSLPNSQFAAALNELIDLSEMRRAALENHVPELVVTLLIIVTLVAFALIAYSLALNDPRRHAATYVFALMIAFVLTAVLDLDRPRRGWVQVSQASMERVLQDLSPSK